MKKLLTLPLLALTLLGVIACGADPDLAAIREGIRSMSLAAEKRDTDSIIEYIDDNYTGVAGNRSGVANVLSNHFSLNKSINIIISDINIQFAEDRQTAQVRVRVLLTGGEEGKLPERGRLSQINSRWTKQGEHWRVTRASWKPVLLSL